ncbi:MAG: hypothetical protein RL376_1902, partial [Verrucomicrobiota bacterium]
MKLFRAVGGLVGLVVASAVTLPAQELTRDAGKLYAEFCASCHGANLEGGQGTSLLDDVWNRGDGSDEHLTRMIAEGLPDMGMPGFGTVLDAPRVRGLVVYLREKAVRAQEAQTAYAKPVEGLAVKGRAA